MYNVITHFFFKYITADMQNKPIFFTIFLLDSKEIGFIFYCYDDILYNDILQAKGVNNMEKKYTYHPMHMHIHTCFQPGMSMAAQMYNAKSLNMHYIWLTDHDTRTGFKKNL